MPVDVEAVLLLLYASNSTDSANRVCRSGSWLDSMLPDKLPQRSCSYDVTLQVFEPSSNEGACKQNVSNIAQIRQLTVETYSTLLIFFLVDDYRVFQSWLRALDCSVGSMPACAESRHNMPIRMSTLLIFFPVDDNRVLQSWLRALDCSVGSKPACAESRRVVI